jgi:glycosyltransferase involved in cell wall biosynthesis
LEGKKELPFLTNTSLKKTSLIGVTTKNNDPALVKGYRLMNILTNNRLRYGNIFLFGKIKKIISNEKITHLITEHPYYGWLAWMLRKATGVKWVVHSHNIEYMRSMSIGRWWWKALKRYEGWAYRKADKVFFISDDDRKHATEHLGVDPAKSLTVTYGIERNGIPADRQECRRMISEKYSLKALIRSFYLMARFIIQPTMMH